MAPAPHGGRLVAAAPWTAIAVVLAFAGAWAALFANQLPRTIRRRVRRIVVPAARGLRGLHSGRLGDSVTWVMIGTAGIGVLLAAMLR
jgi:hypothetical protein